MKLKTLSLGQKALTNLFKILNCEDITGKDPNTQTLVYPVVMYRGERGTRKTVKASVLCNCGAGEES